MKQKKVLSKGFTITCKSWENVDDNYQTNSKTYETADEANLVYDACMFIKDIEACNVCEDEDLTDKQEQLILEFYANNNIDYDVSERIQSTLEYMVHPILGMSEYYQFRAYDSIDITHAKEDVYANILRNYNVYLD